MGSSSKQTGAPRYRVLDPRQIDAATRARAGLMNDVLMGFSTSPKRIPSQYFYDDRGSALFAKIMQAEAYYPTRCEHEILSAHSDDIARSAAVSGLQIVELGAGNGKKTKTLLEAFCRTGADFTYVPVDISEGAMRSLCDKLADEMPEVACSGLVAEYFEALHWLGTQEKGPRLVLFLGSNIGNFDRYQMRAFLRTLWNALSAGDHVVIGFDLKKDIDVLLNAYNDPQGITREFNLNLLARLNRQLDANFDISQFSHFGTYNPNIGAMESFIVSLADQVVTVRALNTSFSFAQLEAIHVECSYKYLPQEIRLVGDETGFCEVGRFFDRQNYFSDVLWRVDKDAR